MKRPGFGCRAPGFGSCLFRLWASAQKRVPTPASQVYRPVSCAFDGQPFDFFWSGRQDACLRKVKQISLTVFPGTLVATQRTVCEVFRLRCGYGLHNVFTCICVWILWRRLRTQRQWYWNQGSQLLFSLVCISDHTNKTAVLIGPFLFVPFWSFQCSEDLGDAGSLVVLPQCALFPTVW